MVRKPFVRSPYNYDMDVASDESGLECKDLSLAVQSSRDEVDINTIVRRFGLTGQLPQDVGMPQFADFDQIFDYHSAMNLVAEANEGFERMPADIRARFHNDPAELVAFVSDSSNIVEARRLGIVDRPAAPAVSVVVAQPVEPTRPVGLGDTVVPDVSRVVPADASGGAGHVHV